MDLLLILVLLLLLLLCIGLVEGFVRLGRRR